MNRKWTFMIIALQKDAPFVSEIFIELYIHSKKIS